MSLRSILQELCEFDTALIANTLGYIDATPAHEWFMSGDIQSVTPFRDNWRGWSRRRIAVALPWRITPSPPCWADLASVRRYRGVKKHTGPIASSASCWRAALADASFARRVDVVCDDFVLRAARANRQGTW